MPLAPLQPGRIAPTFISWYVRTRWQGDGALDEETIDVVARYAVGVVMMRGCSEKSLSLILQPIAQTRTPIGPIVENELPAHIPVVGGCTSSIHLTRSLKAPGFNP
jgi:hypothetical protein